MDKESVYVLIIILVIIIFFVIYYYYLYSESDNININLNFKSIKFNVQQNENTIYNVLEDNFKLLKNQSLMVHTEIPKGYPYWGITPVLYEDYIYKNIGDTISIAEHFSMSRGGRIVIILVSNKNLFKEIEYIFTKEFRNYSNNSIKIIPIYIEPDKYYKFICTTVLNNKNEIIPKYKARLYTSKLSLYDTPEINKIIMKSKIKETPESKYYDIIKWNEKCDQIIKEEFNYNYKKGEILYIVNDNQYLNTDISYIFCDIDIKDDEKIIIVALDHSMSNKCIYSDVSFIDKNSNNTFFSYITGNSNNKVNLKDKFIIHYIQNTFIKYNNIRITEKLYVNYDSKSRPDINFILPMNVYIIKK